MKIEYEIDDKHIKLSCGGSIKELAMGTCAMINAVYKKMEVYGPEHAKAYKKLIQLFVGIDDSAVWTGEPGGKGVCVGFDPEEVRKQAELADMDELTDDEEE